MGSCVCNLYGSLVGVEDVERDGVSVCEGEKKKGVIEFLIGELGFRSKFAL